MIRKEIKYIVFDADDTLWVNEPFFRETEATCCKLLSEFAEPQQIMKILYDLEVERLPLYGYGIKGFMLCMIETAMIVSQNKVSSSTLAKIIELGKAQLTHAVELLDGVEDTLIALSKHYPIALATKGDLLDQQRKIKLSGLSKYFSHIEIMSDKKQSDYEQLVKSLNVASQNVMMVGNSLKSDVLPVLKIGGYAIHIPCHTTWIHEVVEEDVVHPKFKELENISELKALLL